MKVFDQSTFKMLPFVRTSIDIKRDKIKSNFHVQQSKIFNITCE